MIKVILKSSFDDDRYKNTIYYIKEGVEVGHSSFEATFSHEIFITHNGHVSIKGHNIYDNFEFDCDTIEVVLDEFGYIEPRLMIDKDGMVIKAINTFISSP